MRIDKLLCLRELAGSRAKAQEMIACGAVYVGGRQIKKPAEDIDEETGEPIEIRDYELPYVGRGGLKLAAALAAFSLDVSGMVALDIGASTGGFTDCLLKNGAKFVYALDAGHGQLDPSLTIDARVASIENFNARYITPEDIGRGCDVTTCNVVTMDVSFISQTFIIPRLPALGAPGMLFISLIKPQFEAGREYVGKGGIVHDKKGHRRALERVLIAAADAGFELIGVDNSPMPGGDGNREFIAAFRYTGEKAEYPEMNVIYNKVGL